jgi:hypothetical protein
MANLAEWNMHAGQKLNKALAGKGLVVTPGIHGGANRLKWCESSRLRPAGPPPTSC